MAVPSVSFLRGALLACACVCLAPLARAEAPAASAPPAATAVQESPADKTALAPAPEPRPLMEEHATPPGAGEESESVTWMLTRTLLLFGAVLASIYLTLNVGLRKLMGLQGVPMGRPSVVSVVERVPLDQRRTLFVLKAAGEYLLVGGGEAGLQLLSKLDTESVERIRSERPPAKVVPLSPFLQKLLARRDATPQGSTQPSGSPPPGA